MFKKLATLDDELLHDIKEVLITCTEEISSIEIVQILEGSSYYTLICKEPPNTVIDYYPFTKTVVITHL